MSDEHESLRGRRPPAELDPETFAAIGHRLVDDIAELMASMRDRPLALGETPADVRAALDADAPLPDEGTDPAELTAETTRLLFDHSLYNAHPRFFGYITAGAAPMGVLADLLASAANPNVGAWVLSPMASEMEDQAVRWIAELVGYPAGGDGVMVSGGNAANMLGFWAARVAKAGWNVRGDGMRASDARPLRVYGSAGTHTWIEKAADLSGLGSGSIRWIGAYPDGRMDVSALSTRIEADLAAGDRPFMVVATGGSVSTGAVDPIPELRRLCDAHDLWLHVDGAYGAFAAASPAAPDDLRALSLADSVALDPHKWLYAPLEAGCTLVRDPGALVAAFSHHPDYYHFGQGGKDYVDRGIQNSRGFRALKVWLQLKHVGRAGYERMITEDIELAKAFFDIADAHAELEALTHALSITTYRYVPDGFADRHDEAGRAYLNDLNREIQARMEKSGQAFVSNAVLGEVYALRMCIVNFRTTLEDVERLADITVEIGRAVHGERSATAAVS